MKGPGHHITGIAAGAIGALGTGADLYLTMLGAWVGGTAPDWLELKVFGTRLIPHRRITHWMLAWAVLVWAAQHYAVGPLAYGFALGGLTHCLVDFPNPMGVPVFRPWARSSLNWWRSGQHEVLICSLAITLAMVRHTGI